jgi:hypothetical protein
MEKSPEHSLVENRLLAALPPAEYARLLPSLELLHFHRNKFLYEAGDKISYAYFINSGIASSLATTETGQAIDISMIGVLSFCLIAHAHALISDWSRLGVKSSGSGIWSSVSA